MPQPAAWLLLFFLGIVLIIIGFTGKLGMVFAVAFTPGLLTVEGATPLKNQSVGQSTSASGKNTYQAPFTGVHSITGGAYPPGTLFGGVPK